MLGKKKSKRSPEMQRFLNFLDDWKYLLLFGAFIFLILYMREETKTKQTSYTKKEIKVKSTSEIAKEEEDSYEEEEEVFVDEEELAELAFEQEQKNEVKKEKEKEILQVFNKNFTNEEEKIRSLLAEFGYEFSEINEFSSKDETGLTEEELALLRKFQKKENNFSLIKRELEKYEKINLADLRSLRKHRGRMLKSIKGREREMEAALLSKLNDPFLSTIQHREMAILLGMVGTSKTFESVLFLFSKETDFGKKANLLFPLAKLDLIRGYPEVIKALENPSKIVVEKAIDTLKSFPKEGIENLLEPLVLSKKQEIVDAARYVLLEINSPLAIKILKKYPKEGEEFRKETD